MTYCGLNEVTPHLRAAVAGIQELPFEVEAKSDKCSATTDISTCIYPHHFGSSVHAIVAGASSPPGMYCPRVGTQPYHLPWTDPDWPRMGEAPEHLQYLDDIIMWGNRAEEVFEKGKEIIQIILRAGFTV